MHLLFYLDPGSGSFIIQLLLAVLLGAGVAIKLYWNKILTLLKIRPSQPINEQDTKDTDREI